VAGCHCRFRDGSGAVNTGKLGVRRIYLDGGQLVQSFLREGLVADLVVTTVPVLIGAGRPLFGALPEDVDLKLASSRVFASGLVQSTYLVAA